MCSVCVGNGLFVVVVGWIGGFWFGFVWFDVGVLGIVCYVVVWWWVVLCVYIVGFVFVVWIGVVICGWLCVCVVVLGSVVDVVVWFDVVYLVDGGSVIGCVGRGCDVLCVLGYLRWIVGCVFVVCGIGVVGVVVVVGCGEFVVLLCEWCVWMGVVVGFVFVG